MGTSSPSGGPKGQTPLIPSWLDQPGIAGTSGIGSVAPVDGGAVPPPPAAASPMEPPSPAGNSPIFPIPAPGVSTPPAVPPLGSVLPPLGTKDRFTSARSSFSRFARSGGTDLRSLRRAASRYVTKASGGPSGAARRMGAARATGAGLLSFMNEVKEHGATTALRHFNLAALAGRRIEDVFIGLADCICPTGGRLDSSIARDAFIETIGDLAESGINDLNSLTVDQMQTVFELYATHAIEARICNDIGMKAVSLPRDVSGVQELQAQLHDFIQRGVADALTNANASMQTLSTETVLGFVDGVYEAAFEILQTMGEAEGENE